VKAPFDTNAAAYWMAGSPRFHLPLKQLLNELRGQRATLFLSAVSLQEILVFSRTRGTADDDHAFLLERFNVLPFDEPCALTAARLAALLGSPRRPDRRKAGPVSDLAVDIWQRDAAIAGTAEQYGMELLVTCDRRLRDDFSPHVNCGVRLIEGYPPKNEAVPPDSPKGAHEE
jgi:predicted nucleic acid-binding protein